MTETPLPGMPEQPEPAKRPARRPRAKPVQPAMHTGEHELRAVSYGGGVQSTSLLVLAATGLIDFPLFLMANTGDDSENPETLTYVRDVAMPYAEQHGIELVLLDRHLRDGTVETLLGRLTKPGSRSLGIPVRMPNGKPGNRSCTTDFKIKVVGKELKRRGASAETPALVGIGISLDEAHRINARGVEPYEHLSYPLVGVGVETGLRMTRSDCARLIADAGLPVPPKSACYFCPFHRRAVWAEQRRSHPDLFEKSAELEDLLIERRTELGRHPVFLSDAGIPLREAISTDQTLFDDDDGSCETGWCFT